MYSIDKNNLLRHVGVTWQGKVPIISLEGLHQLHIFIFVMTVVHVVYCCATVFLGFYKVWGLSTQSICFLYWYSADRVAISLWWEWLQFFRRCMDGKSGKWKPGRKAMTIPVVSTFLCDFGMFSIKRAVDLENVSACGSHNNRPVWWFDLNCVPLQHWERHLKWIARKHLSPLTRLILCPANQFRVGL